MKKIKGSLSKPEPGVFIAAAALSLCALLPLRVYQVSSAIDPQTGFFSKFSFTIPLFYILGAAVILFLMVGSFINSKACRVRDCMAKSKPLGIVSALTALSIMFDSVYQLYNFIEMRRSFSEMLNVSMFSFLTKSGGLALLFEAIFGVFAAFFFWIYTVSCFNKQAKMSSFRILSVAPVIWAICRIIFRFVRKISFINISDLLLELFMLVFLISFTLAFAQVVTNVTPDIIAWRLYGCGLPAALLCFLISVPRLFLIVTRHSELLIENYSFNPCDLMLALFIPLFLYYTATAKKTEEAKKD